MRFPSAGLVAATLAALRPGGRFVEIGKRGIWSAAAVQAVRPDVQYSLLAIDFVPPSIMGRMLGRITQGLAGGLMRPLQSLSYSLGSVAGAMRAMMQAQHTGKIVVRCNAGESLSCRRVKSLSLLQDNSLAGVEQAIRQARHTGKILVPCNADALINGLETSR